jgi:hypothetical protein
LSNIKEKAPGGNPMLIPVTPSFEVDDSPFVEPLNSSGEPENSQEIRYYNAILPTGEVVQGIATENQSSRHGTFIDDVTLDRFYETRSYNALGLYVLLHKRSYTDKATGFLRPVPTDYRWLMEQTGLSERTLRDQLDKLIAAGFLQCWSGRKRVAPGDTKWDGNTYLLNYLHYYGKQTAMPIATISTAEEPSITTRSASVGTSLSYDENSLNWQKPAETPGRNLPTDYLSFNDCSKDLLRERAQKSTELGRRIPVNDGKLDDPISFSEMAQPTIKRLKKTDEPTKSNPQTSPATVKQVEALDKHLGAWTASALRLYEVKSLDELSAKQADQLIKLTQGQNDLLKNLLTPICGEIQSEQLAEKTRRDREAAQEKKRLDDEENKAAQEEQIAKYGSVLTPAEKKQRLLDALKAKR